MTGALVLITGTGRSGTSTMSGALHHLGLFVPGPHLGANDSNPKGFFESSWAVRFHKQIARAARINEFDSDPAAFGRVQAALTAQHRATLADFLRQQAAQSDQVVVKDPRSVWTQQLWRAAAQDAGLGIRYLSMLRHPAEVVGSRATYYSRAEDEAERRRYETFNVARWVNSSLVSERATRGQPRAFVGYPDLLDDWRAVARRLSVELSLTYPNPPAGEAGHAVDSFVDPSLRRHQVTWDDLDVPSTLVELAERVWAALGTLAGSAGADDEASEAIDGLAVAYRRLFEQSCDIAHDATEYAKDRARRAGARSARPDSQTSLAGVPGRALLGELGRRAAGRVRVRVGRRSERPR